MTEHAKHSKYSASAFEAAALCPGKPLMERGKPEKPSTYADEGTAAHTLLSWCIEESRPAAAYIGRQIPVGPTKWAVTAEMATAVQTAIDNITAITAGGGGGVMSEQRVNYSAALRVAEDEGWGTADIIAVVGSELQVHDYKHGMGVRVSAGHDDPRPEGAPTANYANPNWQLALYALGAIAPATDLFGPFDTVRLVIHQPRVTESADEYVIGVDDLRAWCLDIARPAVLERVAAEQDERPVGSAAWSARHLRASDKACRFCKAKATCPVLRDAVLEPAFGTTPATPEEFDAAGETKVGASPGSDAKWLAAAMGKTSLIEGWLKAVAAEVERRLLASEDVPGYKLVQGRQGNRAWSDVAAAETALKAMRLKVDQMYDLSLISPTTAEKLTPKMDKKGKAKPLAEGQTPPPIGPRQWKTLQGLIVRAEGKPSVAPASDPGPALVISAPADDFDNLAST